jgi:predicted RNase H-like HicB family nuclease
MSMKWRVILEPDPETSDWAVWCPELPGCFSCGESQTEALENIQEAIALSPIELQSGAITCEVTV